MRFLRRLLTVVFILAIPPASTLFAQTPGFFKDIFSDGGVSLTSRLYMDAPELLGLSVEYLGTSDEDIQTEVMISNAFDTNGHLLYPDGSPRFRMIYTTGGSSSSHRNSLGEFGRVRVRNFYASGGSFTGSCAGAFIASLSYQESGISPAYYHIWPGRTHTSGLLDSYTGHFLPADSPLLNYFNFGNDHLIENVRHNGGCWARENLDFPIKTEILTRYDSRHVRVEMHDKASTWAYKPDTTQGRVVVTGSHPEGAWDGEILSMMQAILLYALDGVGNPVVKANLMNSETRTMDLFTEDSLPEFTRIGDRQYHHYTISIPPGTSDISIELNAEAGFDFNLYANPGSYAFEDSTLYASENDGNQHVLNFSPQESGLWYIGVDCATTVEDFYTSYSGQLEVLNGVAYDVTASWNTVGVADAKTLPSSFELHQNYPNPFNPSTTINFEMPGAGWITLMVYDVNGREVVKLIDDHRLGGRHTMKWFANDQQGKPLKTGLYLYEMKFKDTSGKSYREVRKFTLLK